MVCDIAGKVQTRVPHQAAALPARPLRQVERDAPRPVGVHAVHHAVGMEEGILDAHQQDERERRGGWLTEEGRDGDVRVQVGQDHVGQVRQPLGPGGAVPLDTTRIGLRDVRPVFGGWLMRGWKTRRRNRVGSVFL